MTDPDLMRLLARATDALERLAPAVARPADPRAHPCYRWADGALRAVSPPAALPLEALVGMERQKAAFVGNLERLAAGRPAHDALLWGARGTGKSALVLAGWAAARAAGDLVLVAVPDADALEPLFEAVAGTGRTWLAFLDDLSADDPADARRMRSLLDGGGVPRPDGVSLAVTANRRHLRRRDHGEADSVAPRDEADDALALADRFGLSLGFHVMDQDTYLAAARLHAERVGAAFDAAAALDWATARGHRSGRVARQYAVEAAGA